MDPHLAASDPPPNQPAAAAAKDAGPVPSIPSRPSLDPSPSFRRPWSSLPLSAMELPRSQSRGEGLEFEFDLGSGSGSGFGPAVPTEDDRIENVAALLRSVSDIAEMEINGTPPRPSSFDAAAAAAADLLRPRQAAAPPMPPQQQQQQRQQRQPQRPPPVGRPLFRPPPPAPFSAAAAAAAAAAATQARSGRGRAVSICDLDGSPPPGCSASFASLLPQRQEVHPSQPPPPPPSGTSVRITPVSSPRLGFLGSSLELVSPGRALTMPAVAVARDGSDPSSPSHLSPGLPRKVSIEFDLEAAAEASAVPAGAGAGAGAGARAGRPLLIRKRFCWRDFPELEAILISSRRKYLKYSTRNYTPEQKRFNNSLTTTIIATARDCGYLFDPDHFDFGSVRDRIRCFYKSYVQGEKKRLFAALGTAADPTDIHKIRTEIAFLETRSSGHKAAFAK